MQVQKDIYGYEVGDKVLVKTVTGKFKKFKIESITKLVNYEQQITQYEYGLVSLALLPCKCDHAIFTRVMGAESRTYWLRDFPHYDPLYQLATGSSDPSGGFRCRIDSDMLKIPAISSQTVATGLVSLGAIVTIMLTSLMLA